MKNPIASYRLRSIYRQLRATLGMTARKAYGVARLAVS